MKGLHYRFPADCHRILLCTIEASSASEVLLPRLPPATILQSFAKILRDESIHLNFGIDVINQIRIENPQLWAKTFQEAVRAMIRTAAELEASYGRDTMPRGFLGLNAALCETYMHFIANRRCAQFGIARVFEETQNPCPWANGCGFRGW
jgi:ribonucleotide reductase beta subunit family protein with ferritin-like domain